MKTTIEASTDAAAKAAEDPDRARRKQAAVKATIKPRWRTARGAMEDTPESREAWDLGEQWRRAQTDP